MREYSTYMGGIEHRLLLDDADARKLGLLVEADDPADLAPAVTKADQAEAVAKSRTPRNKAREAVPDK